MRSGSLPGVEALDRRAELERLERLADLLDSRYRIPLTNVRFGLDAIIGLIPGAGDAVIALPAIFLIWRAHRLGAPPATLMRMAANVGIDTVVGSVPLAGSVFDVFFKANRRNFAILRRHLAED